MVLTPGTSAVTTEPGLRELRPLPGPGLRHVPPRPVQPDRPLRARIAELQEQLRRLDVENTTLHRRLAQTQEDLKKLRTRLRAESRRDEDDPAEPVIVFADDEEWVRHEITMTWLRRFSPADRVTYPLQAVTIGRDFAESIRRLPAPLRTKAWRCAVDVAAGRWREVQARSAHPLRVGPTAQATEVVRPSDGARCIRLNVESQTPAARRMHFWLLADGGVELSRVVAHDDMRP
ncbi:cell division protein ZapB [Cnuibacter physcomitrellae]|uniref:cell division protein ZapB n=1 Tax=Cnuibacter physcomitrellae TaxID=1619308 RepID=UPI002175BFB9|nr:cell division protein ZapB [Cnuibacter physcomitrellae]MCS5495714.1 cell division protein ZapB [Cnuibacter physcomitrellae]